MVEPIYCLKPAWCGRHLAGLRPETGLTVRYGATAFKAVGYHLRKFRGQVRRGVSILSAASRAKVVMMMTHGQNPALSPMGPANGRTPSSMPVLLSEALNLLAPTSQMRSQCELR